MNRLQNVLSNRTALPLGAVWLRCALLRPIRTHVPGRTPAHKHTPYKFKQSDPTKCAYEMCGMWQKEPLTAAHAGLQRAGAGESRRAPAGAAAAVPPPAQASAVPMWKGRWKGSSGSSSGDGGSERRQRDHLGDHLADQLVEDELARDPSPGQTLLICSSR